MMKLARFLRNIPVKVGNRFLVVLISITVVLLLAGAVGFTVLWTRPRMAPPKVVQKDCTSCHSEIYAGWHNSAHGDAQAKHALAQESNCVACHKAIPVVDKGSDITGPTSQDFSINVGSPNHCLNCHTTGYDQATGLSKSDGVSCEACHGITSANHPDMAAPVDKSMESCRNCHSDQRFNWDKWEESVHYQNSMTCMNCHDPHTTSLKIVGGAQSDSSQLCKNCHQDLAQSYEHSIHQKIKVSCTDCHIGPSKGNDDFHQVPDHDFKAKIEACNKCHTDQMHSTSETTASDISHQSTGLSVSAKITAVIASKSNEKSSSNPAGYMLVIILFGVAGGGILQKSISKKNK